MESERPQYELRSTALFDNRHWGVWEFDRDRRYGAWALEPHYTKRQAQNALDKLVIGGARV